MSRFRVCFTKPTEIVPVDNQKELNSFIHRTLGHNNYHDSFSRYSISGLQGGVLDVETRTLTFGDFPYIYIASPDKNFLFEMMSKLNERKCEMFGMKFSHIDEIQEFDVHNYYDVVQTVSPILLRKKVSDMNDIKITFKDEDWLDVLTKQCIKKLAHENITDDTFRIELRNPEKYKVRKVMVGDVFNICSAVTLKIYGEPETRMVLYNLGLGNSCGSGFGAIKIYK